MVSRGLGVEVKGPSPVYLPSIETLNSESEASREEWNGKVEFKTTSMFSADLVDLDSITTKDADKTKRKE